MIPLPFLSRERDQVPALDFLVSGDNDRLHIIGEEDFDGNIIVVTFPADEDELSPINDVAADIPITDDNIDENLNQYFIAQLNFVSATNMGLLDNSGCNVTVCTIVDDDEGER